jgi:uncharacterized membrane protein
VPICGIGPLAGLLVLALARKRAWLRAHAWQGLLLALAAGVIVVGLWLGDFALEMAGLPTPGLATALLQLAAFAAYLVLSLRAMVGAYRHREPALPWMGALARRWARNGRRSSAAAVPNGDSQGP